MREIKFRAFNTSDNEMYSDSLAKRLLYMESIGDAIPERFNIMQFTGLHDRNGKEIYEGDIMCWERFINTKYHNVWVVEIDPIRATKTWSASDDDAIVIGNIYENPELLNK